MSVAPRLWPRRLVLLGHPLGHTLSPLIHGAAIESAGLDATYRPLDVAPDALPATLDALIADGAAGNVTIPHKRAVADRCATRTPTAERAGAVNTFWCVDGEMHGDNTDVGGFDASVRALLGRIPADARLAMLGAGGAAGAVATAVERWARSTMRVWSRTPERVSQLADRFDCVATAASIDEALDGATLVVNATPIGLRDDGEPASIAALPPNAAVLDLVYRRGETAWVKSARAAGHAASDGLPMLVEQAALAFERWFELPADRAAMWEAVGGRPEWMSSSASIGS